MHMYVQILGVIKPENIPDYDMDEVDVQVK